MHTGAGTDPAKVNAGAYLPRQRAGDGRVLTGCQQRQAKQDLGGL